MLGKPIIVLSAAIMLASASMAFGRVARVAHVGHIGTFPAGPEWYVDDQGTWHSIRSDWANIQRPIGSPNRRYRRSHTPDEER